MPSNLFDPVKHCQTTATCLMFGHDVRDAGENDQHYRDTGFVYGRKGGRIREYFKGVALICQRAGCKWQHLIGPKEAYRVTKIQDGVEEDI